MKSVLKKELESISVPKSDVVRFKRVASDFIKLLKGEGLRAFVGGSLAKGTLVRKSVVGGRAERQDVDIFVVFNYSEDILGLEKILKKLKLPGKLKKVHGSRDYFHVVCEDVILEVVPVVKNRDPELAENVTDMSLSHVKYVVDAIKKNSELAGEIMLAKTFCRAQRCYGAESYVHGFSGYSLEILVIFYGSFVNFLKKFGGRWSVVGGRVKGSGKIVVDSAKYFRNRIEVLRELNFSKLVGPVVVVDPTYKFRNVCAGLGAETFERFLEVAGDFLKKPSLEFFEYKEINVSELKDFALKKKARFLELELETDRQEGDIAGTKMKKIFDFFVRELGRNGQEILLKEFDYEGRGKSARGYLVVLESVEIEVRGPPIRKSEVGSRKSDFVTAFRKAKGKNAFERKGFWWWKKSVSVERVLEFVKGLEGEMGAGIKIM